MTSPPVSRFRVCAIGFGRKRHVRARTILVEFLVRAASFFLALTLVSWASGSALAQFPIRQVPGRTARPADGLLGVPPQPVQSPATTTPPHPAVARIVVPEKDGVSFGSGTLVDARGQFGLVVSNWHVVRDAAGPITVEFPDGFKSPAEVVKTDKDWDLAALSIYRPGAAPLPVTATAPQPGQTLTIAGYGSGQWRSVAGRCTQYLSPGVEFPHEMVELAAEARQGDSGGPILNEQGELAGVLFGSGPGYTSGSYGGRVLKFLATVVPGGVPGNDASGTPGAGLATHSPAPPAPPQATALHETRSPAAAPPAASTYAAASPPPAASPMPPAVMPPEDRLAMQPREAAALTPVQSPGDSSLLAPPAKRDVDDRFGPRPLATVASEVDERVAVVPNRLASAPPPLGSSLPELPTGSLNGSLAPRGAGPPAGDLHQATSQQLLAAMWRQFGGTTAYDQTRSVLALIGILAVAVFFWRLGGEKEPAHEE